MQIHPCLLAPAVDIALDLASNEIASFTFGALLSNATTTTTEEKADNDIKFRVVNARSVRAASIDTNTGEFLFDATKVTHTDAQQQKKMIDVTVEAIDPRGERSNLFPDSRLERTDPGGKHRDSKNSRWRVDDPYGRKREPDGDE